jgi:NAD(P)-dependent dehydrogenase (short-subunit alcohol dehydrogenase family)
MPYSPSKTTLNAVTVRYARELCSIGIKVNAASPGHVATGFNNFTGTRSPTEGAAVAINRPRSGLTDRPALFLMTKVALPGDGERPERGVIGVILEPDPHRGNARTLPSATPWLLKPGDWYRVEYVSEGPIPALQTRRQGGESRPN